MGNEVVSEGGVGAGVAVGGAEAAGAQGGQPVHTRRQQLCAEGGRGRARWKQKRRTEINTGAGTVPSFQGQETKNVNQESERGGRKKD